MDEFYSLLDSGQGRKLERFGRVVLERPCASAVWQPRLSEELWRRADAAFLRDPDNRWERKNALPQSWIVKVSGVRFKLAATDFGHLGIFPEQQPFWQWITDTVREEKKQRPVRVLNLFAYSGGATLAAAHGGAAVCHLDASKGMVSWARENAHLNGLDDAPIRWIIDDVIKFLKREIRRGSRYEAIILDPPTFGRGAQGEVFKIETELPGLLSMCRELLSEDPLFVLLSCHTPGFTPIVMKHVLNETMAGLPGEIDSGEMILAGTDQILSVPSGTYARWRRGI